MGVSPSPLRAAMTLAQQPRADVGKGVRIGLGWMTTDKGIVWHNGGTGGYRSFIGFTADGRRGVVILTNSATGVDELGFAALDPDATITPARKAITLPPASLDAYVGTYKLADKFFLKVFRIGDDLLTQATGQGAIPIFASAPNEFFVKVASISLSFHRDAKGDVDSLVLHQNGDHVAPRVSAAELPPEHKQIALDAAAARDYVGKFQIASGPELDIMLSGDQLSAQLSGQPALPVYPEGKDAFFYKVVEAQLTFERDAQGKVVAVVLHQNGREVRAQRIVEH